ncbi:MFS transporter [soil metagenome]
MPAPDRMTANEWRATTSLASIFGLRMLGMFLILPVFAVHARSMPGGDSPTLVGLAIGIYGLTQGFLQIPFGLASDRYGRKRVIAIGLSIFALGSLVAAAAPTVGWIAVGRALQGAGAISAAVTALIADCTRDSQRTKAMAVVGSSIGLTFALSLVGAPVLYRLIGMPGIFVMTAVLSVGAIGVVRWVVPDPPPEAVAQAKGKVRFREVLVDPQLLRLNLGIFTLHLVQMSMFVVVPGMLVDVGGLTLTQHWQVYLPVVLASFVIMVPIIVVMERKQLNRIVFMGSIGLLALVALALMEVGSALTIAAALLAFFVGFNLLEAMLPSLISRCAPPAAKGAAMGVYNTTQSLGLAAGGVLGGWLVQHHGGQSVFVMSFVLLVVWLGVATGMRWTGVAQAAAAH